MVASEKWTCDRLFVLVFFCLLCLPVIFALAGEPRSLRQNIRENRIPAQWPDLRSQPLAKWPEALENYFNDNLGLRRAFIAAQMRLFEWHLHTPMRYGIRGARHGLYSRLLVEQHLEERGNFRERLYNLRALFYGRQAWLDARGIQYLLVIPPDKETVLPEDLAWWFPVHNDSNSFLKEAKKIFKKAGIQFLSLDETFIAADSQENIFFEKKDLYHWSHSGYLLGNKAIEARLGQLLPDNSFSNTPPARKKTVSEHTPPYGRENIHEYFWNLDSAAFDISPFDLGPPEMETGPWYTESVKIANHLPGASGSVALAVDSFFNIYNLTLEDGGEIGILPPWGCNFATIYAFDRLDFSLDTLKKIGALHPQLVMDEHCERGLGLGDIREAHIRSMLWGEECLGTLKFVLLPTTPANCLTLFGDVHIDNGGGNLAFRTAGKGGVRLPDIQTDADGYAVVAARFENSEGKIPECEFRLPDGQWRRVERPWYAPIRDRDILYAQIFAEAGSTIQIRLVFPEGNTLFGVLPMPFLDDMKK